MEMSPGRSKEERDPGSWDLHHMRICSFLSASNNSTTLKND